MNKALLLLLLLVSSGCVSHRSKNISANSASTDRQLRINSFGTRMRDTMAVCLSGKASAITGHRSRSAIYREVESQLPNLNTIYNAWLKKDPRIAGKLEVQLGIKGDGSLADVEVLQSSLSNSDLVMELLKAIHSWHFSQIEPTCDVTSVVYPFDFDSH